MNNIKNNFSRGSEWRKWDLQVQTILDDNYISIYDYIDKIKSGYPDKYKLLVERIGPEKLIIKYDSKKYFFNDTIDSEKERAKNYANLFCNFIEIFNNEVGGIVMTDHNYEHPYLIDELVNKASELSFVIVPGVEINVQGVHILVLFGEKPYEKKSYSDGIKTFLSKININNRKTNDILTVCSKSYTEVIDEINNIGAILIYSHCNTTNGLFQERGKTDRTHLADQFNKQKFNILQTKNHESAEQLTSYIGKVTNLKSKYVFTLGTDSRKLENILKPDKDGNYLWVKSDPTFEGLKQIAYEPEERLKIQKKSPSFDYNKPYFETIEILEEINLFEIIQDKEQQVVFKKKNIPLNKNLISIIGGRGEGKSLLVNYLANIFKKFETSQEESDVFSKSNKFKVQYSKNNTKVVDQLSFTGELDNELDFLFIQQNKLKQVSDKKLIGTEIKKLLHLEEMQFNQDLNDDINNILSNIHEIKRWLADRDEDNDLHHNKDFVEKFKTKNKKLLDSIKTKENKEKLERYTNNVTRINNIQNLIIRLNELELNINTQQNQINTQISEINKNINGKGKKIEIINLEKQVFNIKANISIFQKEKSQKELENNSIKKEFEDTGFTGDLNSLLSNAKNYQTNVEWADIRLKEIEEQEFKLKQLLLKRDDFGPRLAKEYITQSKTITDAWININKSVENENQKKLMQTMLSDRDIIVEGVIIFDKKIFENKLQNFIDLRSIELLKKDFTINDVEDFKKFIENKLTFYVDGEGREKIKKDMPLSRLFLDLHERKEYLYTQPKITYKGRELNKLSVGQRGTIYLLLKLATRAFSIPIIFDQPEDDLDNEFIIKDLIEVFKELKKYRQIIIVTHNANLVVNADAEQVIVAKNNNGLLDYYSGSLENKTIIDAVCQILEGGKDAFKKRTNKYDLKNT